MDTVYHAHDLLSSGFNQFTLGSFLGYATSPEEQQQANARAATFFEELGLLATRNLQIPCPYQPKNANGVPLEDVNGRLIKCNKVMKIAADKHRKEGFRFRCRGGGVALHPTHMISPRTGTLFEHIDMEYRQVMTILLLFVEKCPVLNAAEYCGSENAAIKHYFWIRKAITIVAWHDFKEIGGPGDIVEVGQTPLGPFTKKNKTGQYLADVKPLMLNAISRSTGKTFGVILDTKDPNTIVADIMMENICMDSFICSDDWTPYVNCDKYFSGHGVIHHSNIFVHPPTAEDPHWITGHNFHSKCLNTNFIGPWPEPDPVLGDKQPVRFHLQRCKRQWVDLKKTVQAEKSKENMDYHIGEWMYRHNILAEFANNSGSRFRRFLEDLKRVCPGPGRKPIKINRDECECCDCLPQCV